MDIEDVRPDPEEHRIGQVLDRLSVEELKQRIEMLKAEIARLEAEVVKKTATRSAADSVFKF